jgi:hypothetical protein
VLLAVAESAIIWETRVINTLAGIWVGTRCCTFDFNGRLITWVVSFGKAGFAVLVVT